MKPALATILLLSLFSANAFALPSDEPMPLLGEAKDGQRQLAPQDRHVSEGGAQRLLELRLRTAENGAARTPGGQRLDLAADGAGRLLGQRRNA